MIFPEAGLHFSLKSAKSLRNGTPGYEVTDRQWALNAQPTTVTSRRWSQDSYRLLNQFYVLCHFRDKDRDRDPRRWERGGLYLKQRCYHQNIGIKVGSFWADLMFHKLC